MLPWLEPVWQEFLRRQSKGLPHALLLTGIKGVGKHSYSRHLAQWLLCSKARAESLSTACDSCQSCKLWQAGNHPDYRLYEPEGTSRQIRVDDIRQLNEFLAQTPQIGRCQVVGVRPAEVMNISAANALLKTLEEPAGESYLILETERFGSVLPTIRSRCQRISIAPPDQEVAISWLIEQGIQADKAELALQIHQGAPLAALKWLNDENSEYDDWLQQLIEWTTHQSDLIKVSSDWSKQDLQELAHWFYLVLVDVIKQMMGVSSNLLTFKEQTQPLLQNTTLDIAKLITLQNNVQVVLGHLLSGQGNYNRQLLIESWLIDWQNAIAASSK